MKIRANVVVLVCLALSALGLLQAGPGASRSDTSWSPLFPRQSSGAVAWNEGAPARDLGVELQVGTVLKEYRERRKHFQLGDGTPVQATAFESGCPYPIFTNVCYWPVTDLCGGGCSYWCTASCTFDCTVECTYFCTESCTYFCTEPCTYWCTSQCTSSCTAECTYSCTGYCTGDGCTAFCTQWCTGECTEICTVPCTDPCTVFCTESCTWWCTGVHTTVSPP